jgi:hypothetical protein
MSYQNATYYRVDGKKTEVSQLKNWGLKFTMIPVIASMLIACSPLKIIQKSYPKEKLFVSNYVFDSWDSSGQGYGYQKDTANYSPDSIMGVFLHSLIQLELPFLLDTNIQQQLKSENFRKLNKIDTNLIKSLAVQNSDIVSLIPIISFDYSFDQLHITYHFYLQIMIYLVKNDEIIYVNHAYSYIKNFKPKKHSIEERPIHTQQQWDNLVKKVMQPYIDRLK